MAFERWERHIESFLSQADSGELQTPRKRIAWFFLASLVVYPVAWGLMGASAGPLWFDELLTLTVSSQPDLHGMWSAITRGFDSQPPLFYLLERACLKLPIAKQIALRLPSIPAFPLFLIFVFMYVQRRSREIIACLCAHLFLSTSLLQTYQTEARGYCLMMACIAFALVCCQMLPSVRWTALLLRPTGLWESRSFSRSSSPRLLRLILLN